MPAMVAVYYRSAFSPWSDEIACVFQSVKNSLPRQGKGRAKTGHGGHGLYGIGKWLYHRVRRRTGNWYSTRARVEALHCMSVCRAMMLRHDIGLLGKMPERGDGDFYWGFSLSSLFWTSFDAGSRHGGGMDVDAILLLLHAAPGPLQQASREEC